MQIKSSCILDYKAQLPALVYSINYSKLLAKKLDRDIPIDDRSKQKK